MSDPDRDEEEFILLTDDDDQDDEENDEDQEEDEDPAAEPPFKACGPAFLADFRELPGVLGIVLCLLLSLMSIISKLSSLFVLGVLLSLEVVDFLFSGSMTCLGLWHWFWSGVCGLFFREDLILPSLTLPSRSESGSWVSLI